MATSGKKKVERKFVDADSGKNVNKPTAAAPAKVADESPKKISALDPNKAKGLRTGAIILWIVGIIFEVLAILLLTQKLYLGENMMLYLLVALGVDLVAVVIASQLWKKANDLDPPSEKNKGGFFLRTQLGAIMSVIAFLPLLILLLTNKNLDPKTKKITSIVAAAALLLAVGTGIDYNPSSIEDYQAAEQNVESVSATGEVYWTPFGSKYHLNPDCQSLLNSSTIYTGTIDEAFAANRNSLCSFCNNWAEEQGATLITADDIIAQEDTAQDDAA